MPETGSSLLKGGQSRKTLAMLSLIAGGLCLLWLLAGLAGLALPLCLDAQASRIDAYLLLPGCLAAACATLGAFLLRTHARPGSSREQTAFYAVLYMSLTGALLSSHILWPGRGLLLRTALVLLLLWLLLRVFYHAVVLASAAGRGSSFRRRAAGLLLLLLFLWTVAEGACLWIARPHRYNGTLASKAWFVRHWQLNAAGFRDADRRPGTRNVFFLGDSFTAGQGIADPQDRFSERTAAALGPDWTPWNLGIMGGDMRAAARTLEAATLRPDHIVLQWFVNDIDSAALEAGYSFARIDPYTRIPPVLRSLVQRSASLNYLFWLLPDWEDYSGYLGFLENAFADVRVMAMHRAELDRIHTWAQVRGIPLTVVVFPLLDQVEGSRHMTAPIEAFFREKGDAVVSMTDLLRGADPAAIRVNRNDGHANASVHAQIADTLSKRIAGAAAR